MAHEQKNYFNEILSENSHKELKGIYPSAQTYFDANNEDPNIRGIQQMCKRAIFTEITLRNSQKAIM